MQPILPVVFYTGRYPWERLGQLVDLMTDAADLRRYIPEFEPIFVNLPELTTEELNTAGPFGQVLRVVQNRKESRRVFEQVLGDVVGQLDGIARNEHERWQDLLSYLTRLVYHDRPVEERESLTELIAASAKANEDRLEINVARKTIAEALREEGAVRATHKHAAKTLLRQLELRFGAMPAETVEIIEHTQSTEQLEQWLDRFATAKTLADVGIDLAD